MCIAWLIGFPLVFLVNLRRMLPLVGLKVRDVLAAVARPALAAGGMYACVSIVRQLLGPGLPEPALMVLLIAAGAVGYAAITLATNRNGVRELVALFSRDRAAGKLG